MHGAVARGTEPQAAEEEALPVRQERAPPHLLGFRVPGLVQARVRRRPRPPAASRRRRGGVPLVRRRRRRQIGRYRWVLATVGLAPVEEVLQEPPPAVAS